SRRYLTRRWARSSRKWWDTAGRLISSTSAMSHTHSSLSDSRYKIRVRVSSPSTLNSSDSPATSSSRSRRASRAADDDGSKASQQSARARLGASAMIVTLLIETPLKQSFNCSLRAAMETVNPQGPGTRRGCQRPRAAARNEVRPRQGYYWPATTGRRRTHGPKQAAAGTGGGGRRGGHGLGRLPAGRGAPAARTAT